MNRKTYGSVLALVSTLATGCVTVCGPGTVETDGGGWRPDNDGFSGASFGNVCVPISPVSDCTLYQMKEEDGGGWRSNNDGGGWRGNNDGGGWRADGDGGGWRSNNDGGGSLRVRKEPHHPGDAGETLREILYVPAGICRIGVEPLTEKT